MIIRLSTLIATWVLLVFLLLSPLSYANEVSGLEPLHGSLSMNSPFLDQKNIVPKNIPPLYVEPKLPDEGVWVSEKVRDGSGENNFIYKTVYRPSEQFPNAIVYMMLLNMRQISPKLYLGSAEPYRKGSASRIEDTKQPDLLAVTNALWQTRHAGGGGIILEGNVLKEMEAGLATILFYKDGAIDIVEWSDEIAVKDVRDARQLKHLIVKDGKVITSIASRGRIMSGEIGLGSLLNEDNPVIAVPASAPGEKPTTKLNFTSGDLWFLATRSAFGIRPDGNLVFAVGHHINTCDLAKALVLAGCVRGLHGDANPGNSVGVLYFADENGKIVKKSGLSPKQDKSTLERYLKANYPKDFVAFFKRESSGE